MRDRQYYILGIETSCDETAASVYLGKNELSSTVFSQVAIHQKYGGVVPEVASRNHTMDLPIVVAQAVQKAGVQLRDIDIVAATYGAGLSGALLAGLSFAKGLAYGLGVRFVGINHIQAHIDAVYIENDIKPPFLAVVVSGGHTSIVRVDDYNSYVEIDHTLDDACGEAFDKVARVLGLPYPGGVEVERLAKCGADDIEFFKSETYTRQSGHISYSGLKTAAINYIHNIEQKGLMSQQLKCNICASFLRDAINIVVAPTLRAAKRYSYNTVVLAGGVAANAKLRQVLQDNLALVNAKLFVPSKKYCTDNASMLCMRAFNKLRDSNFDIDDRSWYGLNANSALTIDS